MRMLQHILAFALVVFISDAAVFAAEPMKVADELFHIEIPPEFIKVVEERYQGEFYYGFAEPEKDREDSVVIVVSGVKKPVISQFPPAAMLSEVMAGLRRSYLERCKEDVSIIDNDTIGGVSALRFEKTNKVCGGDIQKHWAVVVGDSFIFALTETTK